MPIDDPPGYEHRMTSNGTYTLGKFQVLKCRVNGVILIKATVVSMPNPKQQVKEKVKSESKQD